MLKGIKIFKNSIFKDHRGSIWTSWVRNKKKYQKLEFKHDKFTLSKKNVLRGFHWDNKTWKLISCIYGKMFFVVLNYNKRSKDFLKSESFILSEKKNKQILIPPYFANAMLCLSKNCLMHYKLSYAGKYNDVDKQNLVKWNDPRLKIIWPIKKNIILSKRDK